MPTPTDYGPPGQIEKRHGATGALYCPGCGYNLTGVCTPQQPLGACPECGRAFERAKLLSAQAADVRGPNLIVGLLVWPIGIAVFWPLVACFCGGILQNAPAVGSIVLVVVLVSPCALTGWWLADRLVTAKRTGRDRDELPAFYRHTAWPWLLFSLTHAVLAAAYFAGGCALIVTILFSGF